MSLDTQLRVLGSRGRAINHNLDQLWAKAKAEGWFDQAPGLMNYLMWIEHEVSRNAHAIEREAHAAILLASKERREAVAKALTGEGENK